MVNLARVRLHPGDIWQTGAVFLVVTPGDGVPVGRGQGSSDARDSPTGENDPAQNINSVKG